MEAKIMIKIILSERDFDYEIQALVNSFFPGQISSVVIQGEEKETSDSEITVGISMFQKEICTWYEIGTVRKEKRCLVSGEQDFHKHEGKTAHPYRTYYKNQLKKLLFQLFYFCLYIQCIQCKNGRNRFNGKNIS